MTEAEIAAVKLMVGSGLTRSPVDNAKACLAIRLDPTMRPYVLAKRASWLTWLTTEQRKWQQKTRRPSRARHHDSISIRERYVRCD